MRKTINLKFVGLSSTPYIKEHLLWHVLRDILSQRYEIKLSDDPQWVICSLFGSTFYEYTQYECPRIFYCTENLIPDFNIVDYAISHSRVDFEGRNFYYPLCLHNDLRRYGKPENYAQSLAERKLSPEDTNILKNKDLFCNFIYGFESENRIRETFFENLSTKYKTVTSAGTNLNNMPDGRIIRMTEKSEFQRRCKFTIAFESTRQSGFCTEKILDAYYANTIPIYYGDPFVTEIFNPQSFINVSDYESFDEVIEVIRKLDSDDEAYMKMLTAPVFNDPELPKRRYDELCAFLYGIFDQEPSKAYRRSIYPQSSPMQHGNNLKDFHIVKSARFGSRVFKAICVYKEEGLRGLVRKVLRLKG